jgi:hypothetical protein
MLMFDPISFSPLQQIERDEMRLIGQIQVPKHGTAAVMPGMMEAPVTKLLLSTMVLVLRQMATSMTASVLEVVTMATPLLLMVVAATAVKVRLVLGYVRTITDVLQRVILPATVLNQERWVLASTAYALLLPMLRPLLTSS